jgi:phage repressor protein C with HTH and peptisase S24 domain
MLPRFQPNEIVIVDPHMSPRKNNECVVEMVSGGASVKIYLGRFADKYHFSQYNTEILPTGRDNLIVMDARQVKRVCAIVGHIIHR